MSKPLTPHEIERLASFEAMLGAPGEDLESQKESAMTSATQALYDAATAILRQCTHASQTCEVQMSKTEILHVCDACYNAQVYARRAARKAQLAERPNDCARCAAKPHTHNYGGHLLCGRCLTATKKEHNKNLAKAGALSIFATHLLVNTAAWRGR